MVLECPATLVALDLPEGPVGRLCRYHLVSLESPEGLAAPLALCCLACQEAREVRMALKGPAGRVLVVLALAGISYFLV